jgi:ATP-binding protein involved in chromosome partitioning
MVRSIEIPAGRGRESANALIRPALTAQEAHDIVFCMSEKPGAGQARTQIEEDILNALRTVKDPDLHKDIVTLNFVKDLKVNDGKAFFSIELTTPACPVKKEMEQWARAAVMKVKGIRDVEIHMTSAVSARAPGSNKKPIDGVKNIIAVGSGKGGVGKSTVTVNLAVALAQAGARVGLLDADIYGPNVPLMMGIMDRPRAVNNRIQPIENYGVRIMSMGFLMSDDTALIWRGPMLHSAVQQFIRDVDWGELDYLLIDLPPGTGDVQLTLTQTVPLMGAVVVTTPQDVALQDARKAIKMFRQVRVDILGIVENMAYFECPHCNQRTHIFSHGGGVATAEQYKVPFLGEVPLDVAVREGGDGGKPIVLYNPDAPAAKAFTQIAGSVAAQVSISNVNSLSHMIIQQ